MRAQKRPKRSLGDSPPDLQTQLEELLDQVWRSEEEWRLDNRIALAARQPTGRRAR